IPKPRSGEEPCVRYSWPVVVGCHSEAAQRRGTLRAVLVAGHEKLSRVLPTYAVLAAPDSARETRDSFALRSAAPIASDTARTCEAPPRACLTPRSDRRRPRECDSPRAVWRAGAPPSAL